MPSNTISSMRTPAWKIVGASTVGTIVEFYDFYLYGTASALVFNKLFFPNLDPVAGILASYATYAVGFFARPVGGLVFGHFGDKFGRKPILIVTLLLMGLSTAAIGILPTYASIGVAAPIILTLLRICQGLGAGAEYAGALLFSAEQSRRNRGFRAAFPASAVDWATLVAAGVFALFSTVLMSNEQFLAWGWRIPFLLSLVAVVIGYYVRRGTTETPEFLAVQQQARLARAPLVEVIRTEPRRLIAALGNNVVLTNGYVYLVWALTYQVKTLGIPQGTALTSLMIGALCAGLSCPILGAISDRVGRTRAMMAGTLFIGAYAFPFFWLLGTKDPVVITIAMAVGLIGMRSVSAVQPAYYTELFPARLRYSGIAIAREMTGAFLAGPLPFVATAFVAMAGGGYWPIATIMVVLALVTVWAIAWSPPPAEDIGVTEDDIGMAAREVTAIP